MIPASHANRRACPALIRVPSSSSAVACSASSCSQRHGHHDGRVHTRGLGSVRRRGSARRTRRTPRPGGGAAASTRQTRRAARLGVARRVGQGEEMAAEHRADGGGDDEGAVATALPVVAQDELDTGCRARLLGLQRCLLVRLPDLGSHHVEDPLAELLQVLCIVVSSQVEKRRLGPGPDVIVDIRRQRVDRFGDHPGLIDPQRSRCERGRCRAVGVGTERDPERREPGRLGTGQAAASGPPVVGAPGTDLLPQPAAVGLRGSAALDGGEATRGGSCGVEQSGHVCVGKTIQRQVVGAPQHPVETVQQPGHLQRHHGLCCAESVPGASHTASDSTGTALTGLASPRHRGASTTGGPGLSRCVQPDCRRSSRARARWLEYVFDCTT